MIQSGSFKTYIPTRSGKEQITGFYFAGEILGLDGIHAQRHSCYATALESSSVCVIPFHQLESMCQQTQRLQHQLFCLMSGEIVRESNVALLLGTMTAEERMAVFLLDLSTHLGVLGYPDREFTLHMTREEIGSYLSLTMETVSRIFSKFHNEKIIAIHQKQIRIINPSRLAYL